MDSSNFTVSLQYSHFQLDIKALGMDLLLEIARCSNIRVCLNGGKVSACTDIVGIQGELLSRHQVPEPWTGHLEKAPILFLSSNPFLSQLDAYPRWGWSNAGPFQSPGSALRAVSGWAQTYCALPVSGSSQLQNSLSPRNKLIAAARNKLMTSPEWCEQSTCRSSPKLSSLT